MTTLTSDEDAFRALCDRAPDVLGVQSGLVEKDFFAMQVLRAIAGGPVVFKGGTSLSRAYGIIERFSEDVDVILLVEGLSNNQRKTRLRTVADEAAAITGLRVEREAEGSGWLNSRFHYAPAYATGSEVSAGVLLEAGTRGGPEPHEARAVRPLLADIAEAIDEGSAAEFADLASFQVDTLHPARTLAEKLAHLHHRASAGDVDACEKGARHLYDIAMILRHEPTVDALRSRHRIVDLVADIDARSEAAGWGFTPRPDGGFADSPAFAGAGPVADALRHGYDTVLDQLVFGEQLAFERALDTVRSAADLL